MGTYAINVDWHEDFKNNPDKWINHGRDILRASCKHHDKDKENTNVEYEDWCEKCNISEDDAEPMMNYAYPLEIEPDEERILKIVKNTCLTIMENQNTGDWFLALCGGGMDLSQSIALAYIYAQNWIPEDLIKEVCTQLNLSVGGKEYQFLASKIIEQLDLYSERFKEKSKEWEKNLQEQQEQKKNADKTDKKS